MLTLPRVLNKTNYDSMGQLKQPKEGKKRFLFKKVENIYLKDIFGLIGGQDVDIDPLAVGQVHLQLDLLGGDLLSLLT